MLIRVNPDRFGSSALAVEIEYPQGFVASNNFLSNSNTAEVSFG